MPRYLNLNGDSFTYWQWCFILSCVVAGLGCNKLATENETAGAPDETDAPQIIALAYPLQYLTQRLVGPEIRVKLLLPEGKSATHWQPTREDILRCQRADLVVANGRGAQVASWLNRVSIPDSKICFSATRGLSLKDFILVEDRQIVHSHGPGGEHSHASTVPFTWLDPTMARKQASYIAETLESTYPDRASDIDNNLAELNSELAQINVKRELMDQIPATIVLSSNSNFKFLTRAVGVVDHHANWFEVPMIAQAKTELSRLLEQIEQESTTIDNTGLRRIFLLPVDWKQHPDGEKLLQLLQENSITPVWIDTMDTRPESGDYLETVNENFRQLLDALKPEDSRNSR